MASSTVESDVVDRDEGSAVEVPGAQSFRQRRGGIDERDEAALELDGVRYTPVDDGAVTRERRGVDTEGQRSVSRRPDDLERVMFMGAVVLDAALDPYDLLRAGEMKSWCVRIQSDLVDVAYVDRGEGVTTSCRRSWIRSRSGSSDNEAPGASIGARRNLGPEAVHEGLPPFVCLHAHDMTY